MNIAIPLDKHIIIVYCTFIACCFNLFACLMLESTAPEWMRCETGPNKRNLNPLFWFMAIALGMCYVWTGCQFW